MDSPFGQDGRSRSGGVSLSLRPREAAAALGLSLSTLERLTRAGTIPHVKVGRCVIYPVTTLQEFLSSRTKGNRGDA